MNKHTNGKLSLTYFANEDNNTPSMAEPLTQTDGEGMRCGHTLHTQTPLEYFSICISIVGTSEIIGSVKWETCT